MKRILILASIMGALALPSAALAAGSSTCQSYNPQLCQVVSTTTTQAVGAAQGTTPTSTTSAGTLPFTGLDVGLLVAGGSVLLAAGLVVRRFSRHSE